MPTVECVSGHLQGCNSKLVIYSVKQCKPIAESTEHGFGELEVVRTYRV